MSEHGIQVLGPWTVFDLRWHLGHHNQGAACGPPRAHAIKHAQLGRVTAEGCARYPSAAHGYESSPILLVDAHRCDDKHDRDVVSYQSRYASSKVLSSTQPEGRWLTREEPAETTVKHLLTLIKTEARISNCHKFDSFEIIHKEKPCVVSCNYQNKATRRKCQI